MSRPRSRKRSPRSFVRDSDSRCRIPHPSVRRPAVRTAQPGRAMTTDEGGSAFGERLRRLRVAAGLSQEALAERAGLSAQAVGALETGKRRRPYPHTVAAAGRCARALRDGAVGAAREARCGAASAAASCAAALPASAATPLVGREREVRAVVARLRAGEDAAADADRSRRRRQDPPGARGRRRGRRRRSPTASPSSTWPRSPTPRWSRRRSPRRWASATTGQRSPDEVVRGAPARRAACCWCSTTSSICPRPRCWSPSCWRPARR